MLNTYEKIDYSAHIYIAIVYGLYRYWYLNLPDSATIHDDK